MESKKLPDAKPDISTRLAVESGGKKKGSDANNCPHLQ
jgi:hypothetical protein